MMIYFRFAAKMVNAETVFVYQELGEKIHVECPLGMKDVGKDAASF